MEKVYIERTKVVNSLSWVHGGDPLCTLHRAEGLYGWVRCMEYIYERFLSKNLIQVDSRHTGQTVHSVYRGGPL